MTNQKKEERHATFGRGSGKNLIGSILIALLFTLILSALQLLACAFIFSIKPEIGGYIQAVGCILGAIMAFVGSFFAGKRQKHTGSLTGLLFGVAFVMVLLIIGRAFGGGTPLIKRLFGYAIFLLLSVLGGTLGTFKIRKGHHKKRRH